MSAVEKVARAMTDANGGHDWYDWLPHGPWGKLSDFGQENALACARAAYLAVLDDLAEPTEAMLRAGCESETPVELELAVKRLWKDMLVAKRAEIEGGS